MSSVSYLQNKEVRLHEYRVLFLEDGGSGKAYTIQRIQNNCQKETKESPYIKTETPGMEIADYCLTSG